MYSHELCVESEAKSMEDSPKDGSLEEVGPKEVSPKNGSPKGRIVHRRS